MKGILKKFMKEYKHLQKFYKTKKEFKEHLLSGEVKISIPDMISFIDKQNSDKKYSEEEMLKVLHKFGFDYTYNYKGEKTIYEWIPEWFEEYKRLKQFKNK